jgi:MYXO-CTERM domain-containing protein
MRRRALLIFALAAGPSAAWAQTAPDAPPPPDASATCEGGLCDTTNSSTCSVGPSDPSAIAAVALALALRRRAGRRR